MVPAPALGLTTSVAGDYHGGQNLVGLGITVCRFGQQCERTFFFYIGVGGSSCLAYCCSLGPGFGDGKYGKWGQNSACRGQ